MRPALTKTLISCPWYGLGTLDPRTCHRTFAQAVTIRLFQVLQVGLHRFWYFRRPQDGLLWPLLRTSFNQRSNHFCYSMCISLQPSDVFHTSISQLVMRFIVRSFSIFITWANQFFVTAILRYGNFPCSHLFFDFYIFTWHFSPFHSLVFSTSSSCRWWTTSQQPGLPHRSSLLLFSFLVL